MPDSLGTTPPALAATSKIGWVALIAATLWVCYFSHLGAIGFVGPDEPRYAWIARAMAETGDWVTPRLYGRPWLEKPVLFYWGAALSFKSFGVSEASARLPSAVSALWATLALAWLAWRLYGAERARLVLLMLPTTVGMIGFSHAAATDMPFSGMLTIAMVAAAVATGTVPQPALPPHRTRVAALAAFGVFLGAATLAKGPAAVVLAGGGAGLWALLTNRWRHAFRLAHPVALAGFCITALPWYVLCALRNPDFMRVFLLEHNFARYLTPEFRHPQPIWFFVPILLAGLLIWTGVFCGVLRDAGCAWREARWRGSASLFPLCWAAITFVFFSLSKSKLPDYILPAIPPLMLLAARSVSLRFRKPTTENRWIGVLVGLTLMALALATLSSTDRIPFAADVLPPSPLGVALLLMLAGGFTSVLLGIRQHPRAALCVGVLTVLVSITTGLAGGSRVALDTGISARQIAQANASVNTSGYKLSRSFQYAVNFYQHREVPEWTERASEPGRVFAQPARIGELQSLGLECPRYVGYPALIVCEDPGLMSRLPRGGKP